MMKKYIIILAAALLFAHGCNYYEGNPAFAADEAPRIYSELPALIVVNEETVFTALVSPADGSVRAYWYLDGEPVAEGLRFTHRFSAAGDHVIGIEAVRNGIKTVTSASISVTDPL